MEDNTIEKAPPVESKPGGYKVDNVFLIESAFTREVYIDFKNYEINNEIAIDSAAHENTDDNKFAVALTLDFKGTQTDNIVCTAKIKMLGVFEKIGEPVLTEDNFKKINAPAIIYPFIREHLHNICLKAGIANVFLPTVNFKP